MIKLFIGILLLLIRVKAHEFTQQELKDIQREGFSVKEFTLYISKYFIEGRTIKPASACFLTSHTNVTECNESCLGKFDLLCGNSVVKSIENICVANVEIDVTWSVITTHKDCFEQDTKHLMLTTNDGKKISFQLNDVSPNEDSGERLANNGTSWVQLSIKKLCHPIMGERCAKTCVEPSSRHRCDFKTGKLLCRKGYKGVNCGEETNSCSVNPCINGGICQVSPYEEITCICPEHTFGMFCELLKCTYKNCIHGKCNKEGKCVCMPGFKGSTCDEQVCTSSSCENNGLCRQIGASVTCKCDSKSAAGAKCSKACREKCGLNSICVSGENSGICLCPFRYTGRGCLDLLPTTICTDPICSGRGTCLFLDDGSKFCECFPGWKGKTCGIPSCDPSNCFGGLCLFGEKCICKTSYAGATCSNRICNDPDQCKNGGVCVETEGSIRCDCPRNFAGDECQFRCLHSCSENGLCVVHDGKTLCECMPGYTGNACEIKIDTLECAKLDCKHNSQCNLINGKYACSCTSGWEGIDCSISLCHSTECIHGNCLSGYGCICTNDYTGANCSIVACSDEYCNFHGKCILTGSRRSCECINQFYGSTCQYSCDSPCVNGMCQNEKGVGKCFCNPNFSGPTCEIESKLEAQLNLELSVVVIVAVILILTFLISLISRIIFKKYSHEKLFVQGTIQEALDFEKKDKTDVTLKWENLI